jgi:glutamate-5-semialdehyde dehydrogenase
MDIIEQVTEMAKRAKAASYILMNISTDLKNGALRAVAASLDKNRGEIKRRNALDIENGRKKNLTAAFLDRLMLDDSRIDAMIKSLNDVIALPDPAGEITSSVKRPNGMEVLKMRMPLGVVGIIFESRPNVCVEASSLTLKSGNSVILRGGSDAFNSNTCLGGLIREAIASAGLPADAVSVVATTDREAVGEMLKLKQYIDVIIPRGGKGLVDFVAENSRIPVIYHDAGVCHTYVDADCDIAMAVRVSVNAKAQRPSTCNSMETLLVNAAIAEKFLPAVEAELLKAKVSIKADESAMKYLKSAAPAVEEDFYREYNDYILNIKIVGTIDAAIAHINKYGSHHSDAIITSDALAAARFEKEVDSAAVFVNASTRLHDGFEFGLGAEMGISNQKLHVRGPMALKELTSEKYVVRGSGQIRG